MVLHIFLFCMMAVTNILWIETAHRIDMLSVLPACYNIEMVYVAVFTNLDPMFLQILSED